MRVLLVVVFVPVLILVGVLAGAVLGSGGGDAPSRGSGPLPAIVSEAAPRPREAAAAVPPPVATAASVERVDVGSGAQGAAIFRLRGRAARPGPVVIFLHGWVAVEPARYGPWIGHLVWQGATVVYPAYQTRPSYDTVTPLANVLRGVRAALEQVQLAPGRLVVAGHSAGGALAADYAAVAAAHGLPAPAAVFSVYPGRKLRHLAVPIPAVSLRSIDARTRVLAYAGERDTAVGRGTAARIVSGAPQADATLQIISDDAVDDHSAPRRFDREAQRTFWDPLDALVASTGPFAAPGSGAPHPAAVTP
ncbi:MAG: alpha/beta hydrolase fold domain-containing protein [Actinobacteria bacterium]|nr:alpha/beta hydrolase fold domain-containing protein [Actinomycetota bacterium]